MDSVREVSSSPGPFGTAVLGFLRHVQSNSCGETKAFSFALDCVWLFASCLVFAFPFVPSVLHLHGTSWWLSSVGPAQASPQIIFAVRFEVGLLKKMVATMIMTWNLCTGRHYKLLSHYISFTLHITNKTSFLFVVRKVKTCHISV